jgi:hypothetical protein
MAFFSKSVLRVVSNRFCGAEFIAMGLHAVSVTVFLIFGFLFRFFPSLSSVFSILIVYLFDQPPILQ